MFTIKIKRKALRKLKLDQIAARLNNHLTTKYPEDKQWLKL